MILKSRYIVAIICAVTLFVSGCTGSGEKKAIQVADGFITAYYKADYELAKQYAEPNLAALVQETIDMVSALPEDVAAELKSLSEETEVIQKGVNLFQEEDYIVSYDVIIPEEGEIVAHSVIVSFSEERDRWEVVEIR